MEEFRLKGEVIRKISEDGLLFGKVATALQITPASLPRLLRSNHKKLTRQVVLKVLCRDLRESQDNILEPKIKTISKKKTQAA